MADYIDSTPPLSGTDLGAAAPRATTVSHNLERTVNDVAQELIKERRASRRCSS